MWKVVVRVCAVVLVLAGAAILVVKGIRPWRQAAAPQEEIVGSEAPARQGAAGAEAAPVGTIVDDEVIAEATDEVVEEATTEEIPFDDGVSRADKADMTAIRLRAEKAVQDTYDKRIGMFQTLTPYHVAEAELKKKLLAGSGEITEERIGQLVAAAAELKESFFRQGDFDSSAAFDAIYEARATLELCLEKDPANEGALKELIDVIHSGWPLYMYEGDDRTLQWEFWQRRIDLFIPLHTLWEEHLSKRPVSAVEDLYYAADLTGLMWPYHKSDRVHQEFSGYSGEFRKLNPNPSARLLDVYENGAALDERLAVLKWAQEGAAAQGPRWACYADYFATYADFVQHKTRMIAPCGFNADSIRYDWNKPEQSYRLNLFRGYSFFGPAERRAGLKPWHILLEENEARGRARRGGGG